MPVLYFLAIILSITLAWVSSSAAVGFFLFLFVFTGSLFCWMLTQRTGEFSHTLMLFYVLFIVYNLYALISYLDYTLIGTFFLYNDQIHFYGEAVTLSKSASWGDIFNEVFVKRIYPEQPLAYFIFGTIGYVAENYFDGQNVLLQAIFVSFPAILINLLLYKLLLFYTDAKKAFKFTFLFALLSGVFYYSPWILRDIHMALLYTAGIYIIHTRFSYVRLLVLILLNVLAIELRLEHGLFFLFIPLLYLYFQGKHHKFIRVMYVPIILTAFVGFTFLLLYLMPEINMALRSLENYTEYTTDRLGGGLATSLYKLPAGLKQVAIILYSQISPFPPWAILQNANSGYQQIVGVISFITAVFWGIIFIFLLLSAPAAKRNRLLPTNLVVLLAFTLLFFLVNTANMSERRIMSMYPVVFIAFVRINNALQPKRRAFLIRSALFVYLVLMVLYILLKYLL